MSIERGRDGNADVQEGQSLRPCGPQRPGDWLTVLALCRPDGYLLLSDSVIMEASCSVSSPCIIWEPAFPVDLPRRQCSFRHPRPWCLLSREGASWKQAEPVPTTLLPDTGRPSRSLSAGHRSSLPCYYAAGVMRTWIGWLLSIRSQSLPQQAFSLFMAPLHTPEKGPTVLPTTQETFHPP